MGKDKDRPSSIPSGVKMPDDRRAPQVEAEGEETVTIEWRGMVFEVAADADDWDARTTLAFEQGKAVSGVRGILGPKQFKTLMDTDPKNRDVGDLFQTIAKAIGLELGE